MAGIPYVGDTPTSQTSHGIYAPRKPDKYYMFIYHPEPSAEEPNPDPAGIELCVINAFSAYGAETIFTRELLEIVEVEDPDTVNTEEEDDDEPSSFYAGGTGVPKLELPHAEARDEAEDNDTDTTDDDE